MGSDESIVQAARVSYGKGTKKSSEDRGLIRFLMRHRHTTPLEMCEIKLHCKMPIFVARQWIRHRTANVNEYSARYSEMHDEFYNPAEEHVTGQNPKHRQARGSELPENVPGDFRSLAARTYSQAWIAYQEALDKGVAREIARSVLPVANYTEWYWKIDLHNLFHFLSLRLHSHAQYEIRVYAEAIARIVRDWVPHAWEAFEDYRLNGMFLSGPEVKVLKTLTNDPGFSGEGRPAFEMSILEHHGISKREAREFCSKLEFELIE
jgi:thymidylate synthase (FAD)